MAARKGYTFDACHGCGQVPTDWQGRPKSSVCSNCAQTLKLAQRIAQDQAAGAELLQVGIPTQPHWLPRTNEKRAYDGERPIIQTEFWKLALLCSSPVIEHSGPMPKGLIQAAERESLDWSPHKSEDKRVMPANVAAQFAALFDAIRLGLPAAYEDGKQRGLSLLAQLASGEITGDAFNDMTISGRR